MVMIAGKIDMTMDTWWMVTDGRCMVDGGRADDAFYTVPLKAVARFGKSGHRMNASMKKRLNEEIYQQVEHPQFGNN